MREAPACRSAAAAGPGAAVDVVPEVAGATLGSDWAPAPTTEAVAPAAAAAAAAASGGEAAEAGAAANAAGAAAAAFTAAAPPAHMTAEVREIWELSDLPQIGKFEEYIIGRDKLIPAEVLAEGFDAADSASGEHVLSALPLPRAAFEDLRPFVDRCLEHFRTGALPLLTDGRVSAGPVDITAFLGQPHVQQQVYQALQRREARLRRQGQPLPRNPHDHLAHVVHVSPDGRKVYVGEECDATVHGGSIMAFAKSWKSGPIHSWSGGKKLADMPGARPNQVVQSKLSLLMSGWEHLLESAADAVWSAFEAHGTTKDAARRMMNFLESSELQSSSRLGRSAWNAYSLNISYRTAVHLDGKNVPGSYSALVILEVGEAPAFCGGLYLLPQYRRALEMRQGLVLFHRSGDAPCGLHGNSRLWRPAPDRHRVAIVLYQTYLGKAPGAAAAVPPPPAEDGRAGADAARASNGDGAGGGGAGSGGGSRSGCSAETAAGLEAGHRTGAGGAAPSAGEGAAHGASGASSAPGGPAGRAPRSSAAGAGGAGGEPSGAGEPEAPARGGEALGTDP